VLLVARLATILVLGALDRLFRISPELHQRYPALEARTNRYYPILRRTLLALVCVTTFIVLLEAWGLDAVSWFSGNAIGRRLVSAAITVLIAALIAVIVWEFITGVLDRHLNTLNREGHYVRAARLRTLVPMLRTVLLSIIVLIVGLTLLSQIGVNIAPLLAGAGIVGVAIGFGSQKLVQDFITGIFLLLENAMQVGDFVTVSGLSGTVEALSIRTMRLRAGDGSLHIVPFSSVSTVTNVNRGMGNASVQVTISSREDTDRVGEVLKDIGRGMREDEAYKDMILADFSLWGVDRIDGATATIVGQMPCTDKGRWGVQREFNRRIKKRFHEEGIEIAVPTQLMIVERRVQTQDKVWRPAEQPVEADGGAIPESPPASALGQ
jgi:small-conductance mechanosensitive channel